MKFTFDQVQQAFIDGNITIEQFIEVLVDNFGVKKTNQILLSNLELAMEKEKRATQPTQKSQ